MTMARIAFDLDETLGVPLIHGIQIVGWKLRRGCPELLEHLRVRHEVCLWSVSSRPYVEKALSYGLKRWFSEVYTWDEFPVEWKDIRRVGADFLVDDSVHHQQAAERHGIAAATYIVIPAYGSPQDLKDPNEWARLVRQKVESVEVAE
jgi:hypothetical protein